MTDQTKDPGPFARAQREYLRARGEAAVKALAKNGFDARCVADGDEAVRAVLDLIPPDARVGLGGSYTLRQLDLPEALKRRGNRLLDHWQPGLTPEAVLQVRREQLHADVFLTGTNAVTLEGSLVNIDGVGNRVAAMIFGPGKVVVVAGANKVVEDVAAGLDRTRDRAAPINARRLGVSTPCAELGYCVDCARPERICRIVTIIERRPSLTDLTVILVGEELGF